MKRFLLAAVCMMAVGCSNADMANEHSINKDMTVNVYSAGNPVRTWKSRGHVMHREGGIYFADDASGKYVEVHGTFTVEEK